MYIQNLITILIAGLFTSNIVFVRSWGVCPFLGMSKKTSSAIGMGLAVTFVVAVSTLLAYVLYNYMLVPLKLEYLDVLIFVLVIAAFVQLMEIILKRFTPGLYHSMGVYLPLITTNCIVLMMAITLGKDGGRDLFEVLFEAVVTGLGFLMALIIMSGARERTEKSDIPECFKGFPIALITAAIIALAFYGLSGLTFF
ncbi:MAG: hypothetical protein FWE62_05580 [Firmicutes bacterium]|nr:hypothetical protein [Bacillota bacterium]